MRITVFGASGKVGRLVVWEILRRGHQVHAFVHSRNPFEAQEEVTVVKGEVADTVAVHAALADSDAVISTLGGWGKTSSDVLATGMTTIIPAMQALHLTRIVTLTGAGARWAGDRSSLRLAVNRAALTMMKSPALRDAEKHLDILARSSLDWTSVRAPGISAEGPDGYRLDTKLPSLLTKIPGPAVAKSLIDLAEQPEFHRQAPGIHRASTQRMMRRRDTSASSRPRSEIRAPWIGAWQVLTRLGDCPPPFRHAVQPGQGGVDAGWDERFPVRFADGIHDDAGALVG